MVTWVKLVYITLHSQHFHLKSVVLVVYIVYLVSHWRITMAYRFIYMDFHSQYYRINYVSLLFDKRQLLVYERTSICQSANVKKVKFERKIYITNEIFWSSYKISQNKERKKHHHQQHPPKTTKTNNPQNKNNKNNT